MFTPYVILFNVSLLFIVIQVGFAVIVFASYRKIPRRFSQALGISINSAELMTKYSRIHGSLDIKVNAHIDRPARSELDALYVNNRLVYSTSLYANFYTLWQIMLMHPKLHWLNNFSIWLRVLFVLQIIATLLALRFGINFLIVSIMIEVFTFGVAVYSVNYERKVLREVEAEAKDLLELDKVEALRARKLANALAERNFLYPLQSVVNTVEFLLPHFLQKALKIKSIS